MESQLFTITSALAEELRILASLRGKNKSELLRELVQKEVDINKEKIEEFKKIAQN